MIAAAANPPQNRFAAPAVSVLLDTIKVVSGRLDCSARGGRCRGDADRGHLAMRAIQPQERVHVAVAMQHQFGSVLSDDPPEGTLVNQSLEVMTAGRCGRMVDQHHAKHAFMTEMGK